MIKRVGYACINEMLKPKRFRSCRLKTVKEKGVEYLKEVILHNIDLTDTIIKWNIENELYMYRISSDLMPLVTHPEILNIFPWRWYLDDDIQKKLNDLKTLSMKHEVRLSMHPDQYTVLNSKRLEVVKASIDYLDYHTKVLDAVGGQDLILHVGGVYNDKKSAMERFIKVYNSLDYSIKNYLRIENDDKSYTIFDCLSIAEETGIAIVLDYHHHRCLSEETLNDSVIDLIQSTWNGKQSKIHLSSGRRDFTDRSHSDFIKIEDIDAVNSLYQNFETDLMIEAKKKDLAALRVLSYLNGDGEA